MGQLVFALTCTHAYYLQLMLANNKFYSPEYIQYEHYSLQIRIFVYKKMGERKLDFLSASRVYEPKFARGCMPMAYLVRILIYCFHVSVRKNTSL